MQYRDTEVVLEKFFELGYRFKKSLLDTDNKNRCLADFSTRIHSCSYLFIAMDNSSILYYHNLVIN